jgi:hypothetical protein
MQRHASWATIAEDGGHQEVLYVVREKLWEKLTVAHEAEHLSDENEPIQPK